MARLKATYIAGALTVEGTVTADNFTSPSGTTYVLTDPLLASRANFLTKYVSDITSQVTKSIISDDGSIATVAGTLVVNTLLRPDAIDGAGLGDVSYQWSDLFLAAGAVISFDGGNASLTHAAGKLTLVGDLAMTGSLSTALSRVTAAYFTTADANTVVVNTMLRPDAADGASIGDTTYQWSDLFLATGAVINFANGDSAITHSSGLLTITGALTVSGALRSASIYLEEDENSIYGLALRNDSELTADHTLTFKTNNTDRVVDLAGGNLTISDAAKTISGAGTALAMGGNITTSGAYALTLTLTDTTSLTLPTSGTLAALKTAGVAEIGAVTYNSTTIAAGTFNGGVVAPTNTTRLNYEGYLYATKLYGAVWNDIADFIEVEDSCEVKYGRVFAYTDNKHKTTRRYAEAGAIGIATDTFGISVGTKHNVKQLPIAIGGFVLAHCVKSYPTGTPLTSYSNGQLVKANVITRLFHPERIIATFYKEERSTEWNEIPVNGRCWVKVK